MKLKDLLKHKMIVTWLNQKWNKLGVWLYLANLLIYLVYLTFLTGFALTLPNPQSDTCTCVCIILITVVFVLHTYVPTYQLPLSIMGVQIHNAIFERRWQVVICPEH